VLGGDGAGRARVARGPPAEPRGPRVAHELEAEPVGVLERDHGLAGAPGGEPPCRPRVRDAVRDQPLEPEADGGGRHGERGHGHLAGADAAARGAPPREEGEDRAGRAGRVAEVEVVGAGVVEVDGLLDQAQAEDAGVEVDGALGVAADRGDVVDAARDGRGVDRAVGGGGTGVGHRASGPVVSQ
jgi:hypothetical protein